MRPPPPDHDPPRWSEPAAAAGVPDADAAAGAAFRREPPVALGDAALARIGRAVFAGSPPSGLLRLSLRTALVALLLSTGGGVVVAARAVWAPGALAPQRLTVAANNRATITSRHHRRVTLAGPGTLAIDPTVDRHGDVAVDFALEDGALMVEAGGDALSVRSGDLTVTVPGDAAGEIHAGGGGAPAAVKAFSGELRLHRAGGAEVTVSPSPAAVAVAVAPGTIAAPPEPDIPTRAAAAPGVAAVKAMLPPGPPPAPRPLAPSPSSAPSPPSPTVEPPPFPLATKPEPTEAALLSTAFRKLRADADPAAALAALDAYDRAFPRGWLRGEAALARAEVLLSLGRSTDALPLLESVAGAGGALTRNARLTRGELLARAEQCGRAAADFSEVLRGSEVDELGERALAGRAACLLRDGRAAEARQDLQRYLVLFPDGPRAGEARRLLGGP